MVHDWKPYFPLAKPRPEQERALDELCSLIDQGKRVLVGELGTGVGKSAVAVCLGRWLEAREPVPTGFNPGTVVLTSQLLLQNQYVRDLGAQDLRSSSNFLCAHPQSAGTCGEMSRVRKAVGKERAKALGCPGCPYRAAKEAFACAPLGVTNYSYFLSEGVYAGELPLRHLLVLDEAHNVEDEVRRWAAVSVSESEADEFGCRLPSHLYADRAIAWLDREFKPALVAKLSKISEKLAEAAPKSSALGKVIARLAEENDRIDKRVCQINRLVGVDHGNVLVSSNEDRKGRKSILFQSLEVGGFASDLIYHKASACLLMSATILDQKLFAKHVGLPAGTPMVRVPTPFKARAFGVRLRPVGRMSRDGIERSLPKIKDAIRRILRENPDEKGIIHTVSYKIAQEVARVGDPRLLIQKGAEDREGMIRLHLNSDRPTVLVSPAMSEGLDLRDDLGRFQVICKMPYPPMSDPVVKAKGWDWYSWRTVRQLVQAVGRGVRSESDWTKTYVLDACFADLIDRSGHLLPEHLIDGLEIEE